MLGEKLIVGLVVVKRPDDIVAIVLIAGGMTHAGKRDAALNISGDIQPVPAEALAVVWAGEQSIDEVLVGIGPKIIRERPDFIRCRWQAGEVECQPANQSGFVRFRGWRESFFFQLGQHESIDRISSPPYILHGWQSDRPDGLK